MKNSIKKIFVTFITVLFILCLFACNKKSKTTIASKEEWDALFNREKFEHVECRKTQGALGVNENSLMNYLRDGNISVVTYIYPGGQFKHYNIKDEASNSLIAYYEIGKDIYEKSVIQYEENENVDDYFYESFAVVSGGLDYEDYYDVAEYDEMKECYCFEYDDYGDSITVDLYINDGKIVKKILYYSIDDESNADITVYKYDTDFSIELPEYRTTVSSKSEWERLFDVSKYFNSSFYIENNDKYCCYYLTDNIISSVSVRSDGSYTSEYIEKQCGSDNFIYKIQNDEGEYIEEPFNNKKYPDVITFDDLRLYLISLGITNEYIDCYDELEIGEDYYYLTKEVPGGIENVQFYISNDCLYKIIKNVDYDNGDSDYLTYYFSDIGMTEVDEVE